MFIPSSATDLKFVKSFSCSWWFGVFDNVKFNSFGKWSAFTNGNNISGINISETWGHMGGDVGVSLFESTVFLDEMKVIPSDNDGTLHLLLSYDSGQNTSSDSNISSEWAFLVDVSTFSCFSWDFVTETDWSDVTGLFRGTLLVVVNNSGLLLESFLSLVFHD